MPVYFFDTSALVKRYHVEAGSAEVDRLFNDPEGNFVISSLMITEFVSVFDRKMREGIITDADFRFCLSEFSKDMISSLWIIDIDRSHINKSASLVMKHNLRTLDSLHLAVFLNLASAHPVMVTSDLSLYNAAVKEGFQAIKP